METLVTKLAIAAAAFFLVMGLQGVWLTRTLDKLAAREAWAETEADWVKLTRQDMAGVMLSLGITNGLLAAILAVLLFR